MLWSSGFKLADVDRNFPGVIATDSGLRPVKQEWRQGMLALTHDWKRDHSTDGYHGATPVMPQSDTAVT